jgi:hypothetical protein
MAAAANAAKPMMVTAKPGTITLPTLSSLFAPAQTMQTASTGTCGCGCCNKTSTTVCLTFDTSLLQSLVNMFPKINITNSTNNCSDPNCDCNEDPAGQ